MLSRSDAERLQSLSVNDKSGVCSNGHCANPIETPVRQSAAEPDTEAGEQNRDQTSVDLKRVFDDQEAILDELEDGDQHAATAA